VEKGGPFTCGKLQCGEKEKEKLHIQSAQYPQRRMCTEEEKRGGGVFWSTRVDIRKRKICVRKRKPLRYTEFTPIRDGGKKKEKPLGPDVSEKKWCWAVKRGFNRQKVHTEGGGGSIKSRKKGEATSSLREGGEDQPRKGERVRFREA